MRFKREGVTFEEANELRMLMGSCNEHPWRGHEVGRVLVIGFDAMAQWDETWTAETTIQESPHPLHVIAFKNMATGEIEEKPYYPVADFNAVDFGEEVKT